MSEIFGNISDMTKVGKRLSEAPFSGDNIGFSEVDTAPFREPLWAMARANMLRKKDNLTDKLSIRRPPRVTFT